MFTIKGDTLFSAYSFTQEKEYDFSEKFDQYSQYSDAAWYKEARCYFYNNKIGSDTFILGANFRERTYKKDGEANLPDGQSKVGVFNRRKGEWYIPSSFVQILSLNDSFLCKKSNQSEFALYKKNNKGDLVVCSENINLNTSDTLVLNKIFKMDSIHFLEDDQLTRTYKIFTKRKSQIVKLGLSNNTFILHKESRLSKAAKSCTCNNTIEVTADSILFFGTNTVDRSIKSLPFYSEISFDDIVSENTLEVFGQSFRVNDTLVVVNNYQPQYLSDIPLADIPLADWYGEDSIVRNVDGTISFVYPPAKGCYKSQLIDIKNNEILIKDMVQIRLELEGKEQRSPKLVAEFYNLDENGTILGELQSIYFDLKKFKL